VTHTRQGARILRRFALDICGCEPLWTTGNIIEDSIAAVRSRVDAESRFLAALAGVTDPEQKRKIIGGLFVEVFEEQAARLRNVTWLAQGTIYPDVIESAGAKTGKAHVIKS
jgi:GMP synthase PP-ATPase subunit